MKKKIIITLNILVILIFIIPQTLFAQTKGVTVNIPKFKVSLNNTQIDNEYRKYPLINYNDITYFPMTYYDTRFLGLETQWGRDEGLKIVRTGITGGYRDYNGNVKNHKTLNANIPEFNMSINGQIINNSKEKYPLLIFRDVTYFPLTWRFAVQEFGWDYKFDLINGLQIQSSNADVEKINLPGFSGAEIIGDKENYYYGGKGGEIYQVKKDKNNNPKKIYQLPIFDYGDGTTYANYSLFKQDGDIWIKFHQGGGVMGSDYYIRLNPDGTYEEVRSGYLSFKSYNNMTILANQSVPPGPNNLSVKYGDEDYKTVGDPNFLYGWDWETTQASSGGSGSEDIYVYDNSIYLLGFNMEEDKDFSRIHKVDLDTNETKRVSDIRARKFVLDKDNIYFSSSGNLYKISLKDNKESQIKVEGVVSENHKIEVINDKIYYVNILNSELYVSDKNQSLNPGGKVKFMIQDEDYIIAAFEERPETSIRTIIFDKNGKTVFKSSDSITNAFIRGNDLVYVEETSKDIYKVKLVGK